MPDTPKVSIGAMYLKEIAYGGVDGIVTTFAVVAGFAGAKMDASVLPLLSVLLFGFANLCADGISMALGNFLSTRSEHDVYLAQKLSEKRCLSHDRNDQIQESERILVEKGFPKHMAKQLIEIYQTNENYWLDFLLTHKLYLSNPENENPFAMALATFVSFVGFGFIPLFPYVFFRSDPRVFWYSCIATGIALLSLGLLRARFTSQGLPRAVIETLIIGGTAALTAFSVGVLFSMG